MIEVIVWVYAISLIGGIIINMAGI